MKGGAFAHQVMARPLALPSAGEKTPGGSLYETKRKSEDGSILTLVSLMQHKRPQHVSTDSGHCLQRCARAADETRTWQVRVRVQLIGHARNNM